MTSPSAARLARPFALLAAAVLMSAACSSTAAPSASPTAASSAPAATSPGQPATTNPSLNPDDPVAGPSDPGLGGGAGGGDDGGKLVIPHPGTTNPHPVAVERIVPRIDGRHVTAKLTWTSGVEPCYVLDSVIANRDGTAIEVTVVEGTTDPTAMCIEIAMRKSTIADLGELEPGTYTIAATNSQIPPVTITVS
jgi:hypothetical protein